MTQFTRRRFTVPAPGTDEYRDNYEKTFGKKPEVKSHNPAVTPGEPNTELEIDREKAFQLSGSALAITFDIVTEVLEPYLHRTKEFTDLMAGLTTAKTALAALKAKAAE